ncbi:hypothetical protein SAMN04489726_7865 [Allokutzneria albata]|uniref:Uncharacterized protein n=2 Tax=Allokutzneria albata TaxID=211114 RepID=A0A1H0DKG2_ALLAB|nr:hypothetical protein SAMN04489726_7865 [Allokutzneria albata]
MPTKSDEYSDPVTAAKDDLDKIRRSSTPRKPLGLGQEGLSWNTPAIGAQEAGGAAAFRDANLVVRVSVEGTDYGPGGKKEQPLDPVKAEQDAIRILRTIKEKL